MNNKGLSNLVATVLIVLLALAAVAIVWGFVRPAIDDAGSQINLQTSCNYVEVQPVSCTYGGSGEDVTVLYKVNSEDEALTQYGGVRAIVTDVEDDSTSELNDPDAGEDVPNVLATGSVVVENSKLDEAGVDLGDENSPIASVAPVVGDGTGETYVCPASTTVVCTDTS